MRIVHLSDLHLGTSLKKSNIGKTKKLLKYALEKGFDHLVITGDISDNSEVKDYVILRKLLQNFNLLNTSKTSIIIGNHDIFGGVQTASDVINFPSRCMRTDYRKKVNEFIFSFKELFTNCYFPLSSSFFPYAKVIGSIVLIGINTIDQYSRVKNPFASNGKVSTEQRKGLKKIFDEEEFKDKKKIVLSHHHFYKNYEEAQSSSTVWNKIESYTLKLRGKKKLLRLFGDNNVELILHGHSHEIRDYERKGIRFLNAGGSVDNVFTEALSFILIDVGKTIKAEIQFIDTEKKVKREINLPEVYAPLLHG